MTRPDSILASIARECLGIATLRVSRSDARDFHDVAVWQIEAALQAAFDAGVQSASAAKHNAPPDHGRTGDRKTTLVVPKGSLLVTGRMYLRLFHGCSDPDQAMADRGFDGPTFGPLSSYVHAYSASFRIATDGNNETWLDSHDGMIRWDGCFYGDLEIFVAGEGDSA